WVRKETSSDTTLNFSADGLKGKLWLKYKQTPDSSTKEQTDLGLEGSKGLTDHLTVHLKGNYIQKRTSEEVRIMDYLASAVYSQGRHKATLTLEQQFNPALLDTETPGWRSIQRVPELKWEVSDLGVEKLPLQAQVVVGRY